MSTDDMLLASKEIFALVGLKKCLIELYEDWIMSEDDKAFNNAIELLDVIWDLELKISAIDE